MNRRYHVSKKLFSGFYGTCWKARDAFLDENVCIKTFFVENKDQLKELAILKEFVRGHFDHENLCQVLDVSLNKAPVLSGEETLLVSRNCVVRLRERMRGVAAIGLVCSSRRAVSARRS